MSRVGFIGRFSCPRVRERVRQAKYSNLSLSILSILSLSTSVGSWRLIP